MRRIPAERAVMFALLVGAAGACLIGLWKPPTLATHTTNKQQALDVVRLVLTTCLAVTMVMGPGITMRALTGKAIRLAFLPLFGIAVLVVAGCLAWCLHGVLATSTASIAVIAPTLGLMFGILLVSGDEEFLTPEERRTLLLVGIPLGLGIARSFLFYGPVGELDAGTIARNLVTEPRPDSHNSFVIAQMVAHGTHPYSPEGNGLFAPYMFSSRGPIAGIASAPIMLVTGARPILGVPNQPWEPFDPEGFMAYRIAMIVMSGTALLALWQLVRQLAGRRAARLAVVLGMSTPFIYSELIFTWPKLLAASMIFFAAIWLFERKPVRAGMAIGIGYLFHPSALFGYLALGLLALWPLRGAKLRRPQIPTLVLMGIGTAIFVVAWQLANHGHNGQEGFFDYFEEAGANYHPPLGEWISFRATSLADTVVPFYLPIFQGHNPSINVFFGISPGVAHFFFQYWTSITFGFAITFFPVMLIGLWRFAKRAPWPFFAVILFPFVFFWIYWGNGSSGFVREGIQAWILAVIAVLAVQQRSEGYSWLRSPLIRAILVFRGFEVFADALGSTVGTRGVVLISGPYTLSDCFAAAGILLFAALMIWVIWRELRPGSMLRPVDEDRPEPSAGVARAGVPAGAPG